MALNVLQTIFIEFRLEKRQPPTKNDETVFHFNSLGWCFVSSFFSSACHRKFAIEKKRDGESKKWKLEFHYYNSLKWNKFDADQEEIPASGQFEATLNGFYMQHDERDSSWVEEFFTLSKWNFLSHSPSEMNSFSLTFPSPLHDYEN